LKNVVKLGDLTMINERIIENADFGIENNRVSRAENAACEAAEFFDNEIVRLRAERRFFQEELAKTDDPDKTDKLQDALERNNAERIAFEKGWGNSSLNRRYIMGRSERAEKRIPIESINRVEQRITTTQAQRQLSIPMTDIKGNQTKLVGYAAVYEKDSVDLGGFVERIQYGGFDEVVKRCDCRFLINHISDKILGRTRRNLRLYSDGFGLKFFNDLLPVPSSDEIVARVASGIWSQCSFQFIVGKTRWEYAKRPGGLDLRIIETIAELLDVSVVTYPAYPQTSIGILIEQKRADEKDNNRLIDIDGEIDYDSEIIWDRVCKEHDVRQIKVAAKCRELEQLENRLRNCRKLEIDRKYKIAMGIK